jgi:predicted DNA-binding protein
LTELKWPTPVPLSRYGCLTISLPSSSSYYARQAIIEFLADRADYLRAVATLEREKGQPNLTLAEVKKELGLDD